MKAKITLILLALVAVSCVSTKSTIKNMDDKAPELVLKNDAFVITEVSDDPKYGYDKDYPINLYYRSVKKDSVNQPRFFRAIAGPKGEEIKWKKVETCCPFPIKRSEMGVGLIDVYEVTWSGQPKPVRLYLNIYGKGYLKVPKGFTVKK